MSKVLRIALHEYRKTALRRRFVIALLMPLFIIAIILVIGLITFQAFDRLESGVVGYIDLANVLARATPLPNSKTTFRRFENVDEAQAALKAEEIAGYYVLAPDFAESGKADLFYWQRRPDEEIEEAFENYVKSALVSDLDPHIARRVVEGASITQQTPDRSRSFGRSSIFGFLLPLFFGILFIIALFSGAQYLMQAVVDEKENRTIEIVITSVTPTQLMAGKIIGLAAVGLTQIGAWLLGAIAALAIARARLPFLAEARVEPAFIIVALLMFVLAYLLFGSVMAGIGSAVPDARQGQAYVTPFILLAISPEFFIPVLMLNPNGVIAVILSLFPLTAPLTLMFRYAITNIPLWQVVVSIASLAISAAGAIWLAARIFRIGLLRYGQRVPLREVAASIRF
jgi:ABC-2 type transport system permease protein